MPGAGYRGFQSPRKKAQFRAKTPEAVTGLNLRVQAIPEEVEPRVGLDGNWVTIQVEVQGLNRPVKIREVEEFLNLPEAWVALNPHLALPSAEIFTSMSLL